MQGKVLTADDLAKRFSKFNPTLELLEQVETKTRNALLVRCTKCRHEMRRGSLFDRTVRCESCEPTAGIKLTDDLLRARVKERGMKVRIVSKLINLSTAVEVKCLECGTKFKVSPQKLLYSTLTSKSSFCPSCSVYSLRLSPKEYEKQLKAKRPDLNLLEEYKGCHVRLLYSSKICGHNFTAMPDSVLNGNRSFNGCKSCTRAASVRKGSLDEFEKALKKKHPNLRVFGDYLGRSVSMTFLCETDGYEFEAPPSRVLSGKYACTECAGRATGYRFKEITVRGKTFRLQGYEPAFVEQLAKHYPKDFEVLKTGAEVPRFRYKDRSPNTGDMTQRTYRPDFYLPSKNTIIEVKSNHTAAGKPEWLRTLKRKRLAVIEAGYEFSLVIFNTRGKRKRTVEDWYLRRVDANTILS